MCKKKTINEKEDGCYVCGGFNRLEMHHIFGAANRKRSTEDGLCVYLCRACHNEPPNGAHFNRETMLYLKRQGQTWYEEKKIAEGMSPEEARASFMQRYGRNYL